MSSSPYSVSKRAIDVTVGLLALVVTAPFLGAIAATIKLRDPGTVFFRQARSGKDGEPFFMIKFRTMSGVDSPSHLPDRSTWVDGVPDDFMFKTPETGSSRVTTVGRWLRRTSLDELPQLLNVVRGQMSLVGPRPEIVPITQCYSPEQARRLSVKPGITGWAQVSGRSEFNHGQKIAADLYYVDHASVRLDIYILARTLWVALRGQEAF